jgi:hypothetical protein
MEQRKSAQQVSNEEPAYDKQSQCYREKAACNASRVSMCCEFLRRLSQELWDFDEIKQRRR